jgi:hypothetical protein
MIFLLLSNATDPGTMLDQTGTVFLSLIAGEVNEYVCVVKVRASVPM